MRAIAATGRSYTTMYPCRTIRKKSEFLNPAREC